VPDDAVFVKVSICADDATRAERLVREGVVHEVEASIRCGFVSCGASDGLRWGQVVVGDVCGEECFEALKAIAL
jgi:hypothetical protein